MTNLTMHDLANDVAFSIRSVSDGPAVLLGHAFGKVVDAWQFTIADVGPSGLDQGKGGKYLFTPPGYSGEIPAGYLHVASPNYRIAFAFRSIAAQGKTAEDAYRYGQTLRMYYLSEAGNPPKQKFIDPSEIRYPTCRITMNNISRTSVTS